MIRVVKRMGRVGRIRSLRARFCKHERVFLEPGFQVCRALSVGNEENFLLRSSCIVIERRLIGPNGDIGNG